jgi:hypothetical protein
MKVYCGYHNYCVRDEQEPEEYGAWRRDYDFTPYGVHIDRPSSPYSYEEITLSTDVKPGQIVYVLWMTYNTGDSFGNANGLGEILWVFTDEKVAMDAKQSCLDLIDASSLEFTSEDGTVVKLSNPAWGYFENLESLEISPYIVVQ